MFLWQAASNKPPKDKFLNCLFIIINLLFM